MAELLASEVFASLLPVSAKIILHDFHRKTFDEMKDKVRKRKRGKKSKIEKCRYVSESHSTKTFIGQQ